MMHRVFALVRLRFMLGGMAMERSGCHFPKPLDIVHVRHIGFDIPTAGGRADLLGTLVDALAQQFGAANCGQSKMRMPREFRRPSSRPRSTLREVCR
jgi:hypothetical protein